MKNAVVVIALLMSVSLGHCEFHRISGDPFYESSVWPSLTRVIPSEKVADGNGYTMYYRNDRNIQLNCGWVSPSDYNNPPQPQKAPERASWEFESTDRTVLDVVVREGETWLIPKKPGVAYLVVLVRAKEDWAPCEFVYLTTWRVEVRAAKQPLPKPGE